MSLIFSCLNTWTLELTLGCEEFKGNGVIPILLLCKENMWTFRTSLVQYNVYIIPTYQVH